MSQIPTELYYTQKHEWVKVEKDVLIVGISDFAQNALGDIVYIDVHDPGTEFDTDDNIGTIESVKAAEDLYAPLKGKVSQINEDLKEAPEKINSDPYGSWLLKITDFNTDDIKTLMDANAYEDFIKNQN